MTKIWLHSGMQGPLSVLIVDGKDVMRSLVARAFMRRFRDALVQQCGDRDTAVYAASATRPTVIVAAVTTDGGSPGRLIHELRAADSAVPILALVESSDAEGRAIEAGASYVVHVQNWIRVPDVVATIRRLGLRHENMSEVEFLRTLPWNNPLSA